MKIKYILIMACICQIAYSLLTETNFSITFHNENEHKDLCIGICFEKTK